MSLVDHRHRQSRRPRLTAREDQDLWQVFYRSMQRLTALCLTHLTRGAKRPTQTLGGRWSSGPGPSAWTKAAWPTRLIVHRLEPNRAGTGPLVQVSAVRHRWCCALRCRHGDSWTLWLWTSACAGALLRVQPSTRPRSGDLVSNIVRITVGTFATLLAVADFVHITSVRAARRIERTGIAARSRRVAEGQGVYCMPVLPSFTLTHQWVREPSALAPRRPCCRPPSVA